MEWSSEDHSVPYELKHQLLKNWNIFKHLQLMKHEFSRSIYKKINNFQKKIVDGKNKNEISRKLDNSTSQFSNLYNAYEAEA